MVLPSGPTFREVSAADDLKKPITSPDGGKPIYDITNGLPGDELRTLTTPAGPDTPAALYYITSKTSYILRTLSQGIRSIEAARITMSDFSRLLVQSVGRPVIDKTGLNGIYEIKTLLPPGRLSPAMQALLGDRLDNTPSGISMTRVLEDLGLKLQPNDGPADFIIVEGIDRPSTDLQVHAPENRTGRGST